MFNTLMHTSRDGSAGSWGDKLGRVVIRGGGCIMVLVSKLAVGLVKEARPCGVGVAAAPAIGEVTGAGVVTTGLVVCSWEPNDSLTIWNNNANSDHTCIHTHNIQVPQVYTVLNLIMKKCDE